MEIPPPQANEPVRACCTKKMAFLWSSGAGGSATAASPLPVQVMLSCASVRLAPVRVCQGGWC